MMHLFNITQKQLRCIAISLLLIFVIENAYADELPVIKIALGNWCPYSCDPEKEQGKVGYIAEIIIAVFEKAGFKTETQSISFSRSLYEVREGKSTVISGMFKEDAPDFIFSEQPIGSSINYFYVLADKNWQYHGFESLTQLNALGLIKDYSYSFLDENIARFLENYPTKNEYMAGSQPLERNIKKMLLKRIDAIIEDKWVVLYTAQKMAVANQLREAGQIGAPLPIYIGFSPALPESKHYVKLLVNGIKELKKTGELQTILNRYNMKTVDLFNEPSSIKTKRN